MVLNKAVIFYMDWKVKMATNVGLGLLYY